MIKISRILHAGYIFECGQTQIAFDPIFENPFSRNCFAYPDVRFDQDKVKQLKFAAVFISHYHDDHCSLESLNLLDRRTPIYVYCLFEQLFSWIRQLGFTNVFSLEINVPVRVGSFEVIPRRALDWDVDSLFHIQAAGFNILNVVDSWIDPSTLELLSQFSPWDLVLWPFQTMRELEVLSPLRALPASCEIPPEWVEQLQMLKPQFVVPSSCQFIHESWSWYRQAFFPISYRHFREQIQALLPRSQLKRLNPGSSVVLTQHGLENALPISWIEPLGDQEVDYEYHSDVKAPSTAEISKHFAALTLAQTEKVLHYCRVTLMQRYSLLPPSATKSYFDQSRTWQLSIYDHQGHRQDFFYQIKRNQIEQRERAKEPVAWLTEVPISRLYGALEEGESLSSIYLRVNDQLFEPEIETEMPSVDIMEDPLIRCLFEGIFGSYQQAQLKKLNTRREPKSESSE